MGMRRPSRRRYRGEAMKPQNFVCVALLLLAGITQAHGQPAEPVLSLARQERPALLDTLRDLVSIESGSRDTEGLDRLAELIAARLRTLGGQVELVEPSNI